MSELDTAQAAKLEERRRRSEKAGQPEGEREKASAISLASMFGCGVGVEIGGKRYEVTRVPFGKRARAAELIGKLPDMLVAHAFAAGVAGVYDLTKSAEVYTTMLRGSDPDLPEVSAEDFGHALQSLDVRLTDADTAVMAEYVALVLSRRAPEITSDAIADNLDIDIVTEVLRIGFSLSPGAMQRF